jgi:hypothetical protein
VPHAWRSYVSMCSQDFHNALHVPTVSARTAAAAASSVRVAASSDGAVAGVINAERYKRFLALKAGGDVDVQTYVAADTRCVRSRVSIPLAETCCVQCC